MFTALAIIGVILLAIGLVVVGIYLGFAIVIKAIINHL
jgi:hypothetical protein